MKQIRKATTSQVEDLLTLIAQIAREVREDSELSDFIPTQIKDVVVDFRKKLIDDYVTR